MSEILQAIIETNKGNIKLNLFSDQVPYTVSNFANLALRGYYDGLNFHRVINEFMIQGGCPEGTGSSGPGYKFEDEFSDDLSHNKPGILSMANAGPNTNGSQFFITHVPTDWLDQKHTVFGEVVGKEDMDIVNNIEQNDKIIKISIDGDASELFKKTGSKVDEWNRILDQHFPNLKKY